MSKFDWHTRYHQDALDGMLMLTLEERGAYNTILDLIYSRSGPIPDDERWLAGWMGCSVKKWRLVRAALLVKGKIHACEHLRQPALMNARAAEEIDAAASRRRVAAESGASGGRAKAHSKAKANENNGEALANSYLKTETRTKTEGKRTEAKASVGRKRPDPGSRLDPGWQPSELDHAYALAEGLTHEEINRGAEEFRNYWLSLTGNRATKLNWSLTWRNQILKLADRKREHAARLASRPANASGGGRGASSFADIFVRNHGSR